MDRINLKRLTNGIYQIPFEKKEPSKIEIEAIEKTKN